MNLLIGVLVAVAGVSLLYWLVKRDIEKDVWP